MRLNYLKEHKKAEYTIMFMENTLIDHLEEIQETATKRVNLIIYTKRGNLLINAKGEYQVEEPQN